MVRVFPAKEGTTIKRRRGLAQLFYMPALASDRIMIRSAFFRMVGSDSGKKVENRASPCGSAYPSHSNKNMSQLSSTASFFEYDAYVVTAVKPISAKYPSISPNR